VVQQVAKGIKKRMQSPAKSPGKRGPVGHDEIDFEIIEPQPTEDDVRHTTSMNGGKQASQTPLREKQPSRNVDETPNDNEESGNKSQVFELHHPDLDSSGDQGESSEHKSNQDEDAGRKQRSSSVIQVAKNLPS
jgi:hypothetical protein